MLNTKKRTFSIGFLIRTILLILFFSSAHIVESTNLGILQGIFNPGMIVVSGGEVYVLQGAVVKVFSLDGLNLIREFGREGQGPGEIEITPWLSNSLFIRNNSVLIHSVNKLVTYSKDGKFIMEKRRSEQFTRMIPVGENFAVRKREIDEKEKMQYSTINLFSSQTGETLELYKQKLAGQTREIEMIPDSLHFEVFDGKIFIEESPKGFVIEIFNERGEKINSIVRDYEKTTVARKDKEEAEERIRQDPFIKSQAGGWDNVKKGWKVIYPDIFPAIQDMLIADETIYVKTHKKAGDREEFIILDFEGNELNKVYLPEVEKPGFTEQMMGAAARLFTFDGGKYYFVVVKDDCCELHVEEIG